MTRLRRIPPSRLAVFTSEARSTTGLPLPSGSRYEFRIHPAISETDRTALRRTTKTFLARAQATPAAYECSHPKQFLHVHFVTHGTASRLSPLDSAILLSKDADNSESLRPG